MSAPKATQLKEEGNRHFKAGDYTGAEGYYSKAIIQDPRSAQLYTNRAFARVKLSLWPEVATDCQTCLEIDPKSIKAHYYLSQARLALKDYDGAFASAKTALELCTAAENDKSLSAITEHIRRVRLERWEDKEKRRPRATAALEQRILRLLEKERDDNLAEFGDGITEDDQKDVNDDFESTVEQVRDIFERARGPEERKRKVPEWATDDITFQFMVDPVVTQNGRSYERASIEEHLRLSKTDPLTREPLCRHDLRPNLNLKMACEEFLEENGWAADW